MAKPPLLQYSPEIKAWIDAEVAEQVTRYQEIVEEMDGIDGEREQWYAEFLERIQTRGYHVHADILRVIQPEEIPKRPPDRKLQVQGPLGVSIIEIKELRARFLESPCKGQQCVHSGWLETAGELTACLPNRISIQLLGRHPRFDAVNF